MIRFSLSDGAKISDNLLHLEIGFLTLGWGLRVRDIWYNALIMTLLAKRARCKSSFIT